jgi:translation initiation factor IF-2
MVQDSHVEYISSPIIYHITERIEKIVTGMLDPKEVEVHMATAKTLAVFYTSKEFMVV